jgi:hypothetical protein
MKRGLLAFITFVLSGTVLAAESPRLIPWYGARVSECQIVLGMKDLQEVSFASVGRSYDNILTRLREEALTLAKKNGLQFDSVAYKEPIEKGRYLVVEDYKLLQCS